MATVNLSNLEQTRGLKIAESIIKDIQEQAKSMELVTHMMSEKEEIRIPVLKDGCVANEVAESDIIGSQNINLEYKSAKLKKVGVIVPYSYESVDFTDLNNLPQELQSIIVDAIVKKMDLDVLTECARGCAEVTGTGVLADDMNALFTKVEEVGEVSGLAVPNATKKDLRKYTSNGDNKGLSLSDVYGVKPTFFKQCDTLAVDKSKVFLVTKDDIQIEELDQATITVNGNLISLAERNMKALKVYVYYAVVKVKDNACAKLVQG